MPTAAAISRVVVAAYPFSQNSVAAVSNNRSSVGLSGSVGVSAVEEVARLGSMGKRASNFLLSRAPSREAVCPRRGTISSARAGRKPRLAWALIIEVYAPHYTFLYGRHLPNVVSLLQSER